MMGDAAGRASILAKIIPEYEKSPDFFLRRMWTEVREEILQKPAVIKWFIHPSQGRTVILINTPPELNKEVDKVILQGGTAPR